MNDGTHLLQMRLASRTRNLSVTLRGIYNAQLKGASAKIAVVSEDHHGALECVMVEHSLYAILEKVHRVHAARVTTNKRICVHYEVGAGTERCYFMLAIWCRRSRSHFD